MMVHIHNIRIAIEHAGEFLPIADRRSYSLKRVLVRERIAGIEKDDIVARGMPDTFVHRIIKSTILLGDDHDLVIVARLVGPLLICQRHRYRIVLRQSVEDEMLHIGIFLAEHTVQSALQHWGSIESTCYDCELYHAFTLEIWLYKWMY